MSEQYESIQDFLGRANRWGGYASKAANSVISDNSVDYLAGFNEYGVGGYQDPGKSGEFTSGQKAWGGTAEDGSKTTGYIPTAMNVGTGLLNSYLGMKQYGLAKKNFKQRKKEFELNYDAQQQNVNAQLRDRQRNRVRGNPDAYESVATYMDRNRVRDR